MNPPLKTGWAAEIYWFGSGEAQKKDNEVLVYQANLVKICSKNWISDDFNP